jgi:hypothetical protein
VRIDPSTEPAWWQPFAAQFPLWHAWQGVNCAYYARMVGSSPPLWVRGATPAELPALIRAIPLPWWMRETPA